MVSVRKAKKKMEAWDKYTRRYLVRENGEVVRWTRTTRTDIKCWQLWLGARGMGP